MSFFVINEARTDVTEINSPVFEMDDATDDSAVLVFLSCVAAEDYIAAAGWKYDQQVVQLEPTQLLNWLAVAKDDDITQVVVDANRFEQLKGKPQETIALGNVDQAYCELLHRAADLASPPAANPPTS